MKDDHQIIVLAAYGDVEAAREDFGDIERALKHGMELRSAALVTKDADGQPQVVEAANSHVRTGTAVGAGIGVLMGLVFEPLLLGLLVGGAGGALVAAVAEHELRSGLRHEVGDALTEGTAVILALAYPNGRARVESTLARAEAFRELRMDRASINHIDEAVAEEVAKINAGRQGTSN
jgi:uncharacterized membrane protein